VVSLTLEVQNRSKQWYENYKVWLRLLNKCCRYSWYEFLKRKVEFVELKWCLVDGRSCLYTLWAFGLAARLKRTFTWPPGIKKLDYSLAARLQILLLFSKSLMVYFIVSKKALSASFSTALFLVVILLLCRGWLNDLVHGQARWYSPWHPPTLWRLVP